jgi:hypothetical protein
VGLAGQNEENKSILIPMSQIGKQPSVLFHEIEYFQAKEVLVIKLPNRKQVHWEMRPKGVIVKGVSVRKTF